MSYQHNELMECPACGRAWPMKQIGRPVGCEPASEYVSQRIAPARWTPSPGQVIYVGSAASAQFAAGGGLHLRVIRIDDQLATEGWAWIDGYQLDGQGNAVARRRVFVRIDGLTSTSRFGTLGSERPA